MSIFSDRIKVKDWKDFQNDFTTSVVKLLKSSFSFTSVDAFEWEGIVYVRVVDWKFADDSKIYEKMSAWIDKYLCWDLEEIKTIRFFTFTPEQYIHNYELHKHFERPWDC